MTDARALLELARTVAERPTAPLAGVWPRAAAVLGRQALEQALVERGLAGPDADDRVTIRTQLLCLADSLGDPLLAGDASFAWWSLTRACHHHPYDLPPNGAELARTLDVVARVIAARRNAT